MKILRRGTYPAVIALVGSLLASPPRGIAQESTPAATAASTFKAKCAMCHAEDLRVGPYETMWFGTRCADGYFR
jgi:cytochrome c5